MQSNKEYIRALQSSYGIADVPRPTVLHTRDQEIADVLKAVHDIVVPHLEAVPEISVLMNRKYLAYQLYISTYFALAGWHASFTQEEQKNISGGTAILVLKPM